MKKKMVLIAFVVLAAVAAVAFVGMRLARHGTDIIGVTTLPDRNIVIMNSTPRPDESSSPAQGIWTWRRGSIST